MRISTRKAEKADFERVRELLQQLSVILFERNETVTRPPDEALLTDSIYDQFLTHYESIVAIDESGIVCGFALLWVRDVNDLVFKTSKDLLVHYIVADQARPPQGIGSKLMDAALDFGRKAGAATLSVGTIETLDANCFYRKRFEGGLPKQLIYSRLL